MEKHANLSKKESEEQTTVNEKVVWFFSTRLSELLHFLTELKYTPSHLESCNCPKS